MYLKPRDVLELEKTCKHMRSRLAHEVLGPLE